MKFFIDMHMHIISMKDLHRQFYNNAILSVCQYHKAIYEIFPAVVKFVE